MKDLCLNNSVIWKMVSDENNRQLSKWGIQDHSPEEWLMYAAEELGETAEAISEYKYRGGKASEVAKEDIQTATLILKIAEMFEAIKD
jgi:NTP pyrophosphatase (non-canonical NTP hydrolase)